MATILAAVETPSLEPAIAARRHAPRIDIQLLRALAIILVVGHHTGVPFLPGGFLGVDIFFVVSGFLMTGIIARELDQGRFSFSGFYARRVRRLLPAAYATLTVTAIAAPFLLDSWEYSDFLSQLAGSFTFVVNIVLWQQTDYFNSGAGLKPLLHMWSLAVEEQYYILLPLLLFVCPKRLRLALGILVTLVSAAACIWLGQRSPSANFYLMPTRLWELGIGSVMAMLISSGRIGSRLLAIPRLCAAILLIAVPLLCDERGHPGLPALIVCLSTALLMIPGLDLPRSRTLSPIVAIGDRSYSLYLVHWPILAFANNVFIAPVPGWVIAALMVPMLVWMELQYRLAEQPFRDLRLTRARIATLVLIPIVILAASYGYGRTLGTGDVEARLGNTGLAPSCNAKDSYVPRTECATAAAPRTMLWGDSFAMHLGSALAVSTPGGLMQATRTECGPFLDIAPVNGAQQTIDWARRCITFNDSVLATLARTPSIDTVVLSSALAQYVPGQEAGWRSAVRHGSAVIEQPEDVRTLHSALARTVRAIRALGKRVVLIAPPPSNGLDTARCLTRVGEGKPTMAPDDRCDFSRAAYLSFRRPIQQFLADVSQSDTVPIVTFDETLCGSGTCRVTIAGEPLYRDLAHFSIPGSRSLGREMRLGEKARAAAR